MSTLVSKWLVLLALVLVGSVAACSKKDEDQARKTVEQVKDKRRKSPEKQPTKPKRQS